MGFESLQQKNSQGKLCTGYPQDMCIKQLQLAKTNFFCIVAMVGNYQIPAEISAR
jgi:hypothetical protein